MHARERGGGAVQAGNSHGTGRRRAHAVDAGAAEVLALVDAVDGVGAAEAGVELARVEKVALHAGLRRVAVLDVHLQTAEKLGDAPIEAADDGVEGFCKVLDGTGLGHGRDGVDADARARFDDEARRDARGEVDVLDAGLGVRKDAAAAAGDGRVKVPEVAALGAAVVAPGERVLRALLEAVGVFLRAHRHAQGQHRSVQRGSFFGN